MSAINRSAFAGGTVASPGRKDGTLRQAAPGDHGLSVEIIRDRSKLNQLATVWNGLIDPSAASGVFLTWEWVSTWLDTVRPGVELCVIVAREQDGTVVGVAPFYYSRLTLIKVFEYRCLRVLGDSHSGAAYPDLLFRQAAAGRIGPAMREVLEEVPDWDFIWMPRVAGRGGAPERLFAVFPKNLYIVRQWPAAFPVLSLPQSFDDYLQALPDGAGADLKRQSAVLTKVFRIELTACTERIDVPRRLMTLYDFAGRSGDNARARSPAGCSTPLRAFCDVFTHVAQRNDWLQLVTLRMDGIVRGIQLGYARDGVFYAIDQAVDPQAVDGTSRLLTGGVIQSCIEQGMRELHWLSMTPESAQVWGAQLRVGWDVLIARRTLWNWFSLIHALRPAALAHS